MQFDTRSLWIYLHFNRLQLDLIEANVALDHVLDADSHASTSSNKLKGTKHNAITQQTNSSDNKQQTVRVTSDIPRAVVDTTANKLCQVNQVALKKGIKLNMGLASASLLCSDLQLHEYNPDIESQHIINIADYLYLFTSDLVLAPPNAIILRVQNMLDLYGGLTPYWLVIQQALNKQNVHYVAASSFSVQAAKLLALSNQGVITGSRKNIEKALQPCPLSLTDIDTKDIQKLARIGVSVFADLTTLPIAELANRVSRYSMQTINELLGKQASKVKFYQPLPHYHDYIELLYEISLSDKLLPVIRLCLNKFSEFLLLRNAHCLSIELQFFQRDHHPKTYSFNSIRPIYKTPDWLDIIALKLEKIEFESPVYALSLTCKQYDKAEVANDDMFANKSTHVAALTLLSRLQSKLGKNKVNSLKFVEDFRPGNSSKTTSIQKHHSATAASPVFHDRPGLLLNRPTPLQLEVELIKGPERIQTGWWDDNPINRDYYIAQSSDGQQVWIYKTPEQNWFLHGFFI